MADTQQVVSKLLDKFERGSVSRRELIQHLTFLAAGGSALAQTTAQGPAMHGTSISHVSLQVSNLQRSVDFYSSTFGLTVLGEDKALEIVRLGPEKGRTLVSLRHAMPAKVVDHFAIHTEGFNEDAAKALLTARGLKPSRNADAGFHVDDPDGYPVQID